MNLTDYAKYGISLMMSQNDGVNYYMVTVTYGKKWAVQMPSETNSKVMCAKVRDDGTYCYMTETNNGLEAVFELIDDTIHYNEELEKKVELLKVKAEELKELFASKSYDELLKLKFVIETPQELPTSKNKRQTKSGKKTPQKQDMKPTEGNFAAQTVQEEEPSAKTESEPSEQPTRMEGVSEIDKKIAEAINNKK